MAPPKSRVTIKDVASAAGVSPTTVSDIVNVKGRVDPETRARVLKVVADLGWRPLRSARGLRTGRRGIIALCLPRRPRSGDSWVLTSDYDMRLTIGAVSAAMDQGQLLLMAPTPANDEDVARLEVDGVVLVDPEEGDLSRLALRRNGMPVVTVDRELGSDDPWWVGVDNKAAVSNMLDHLLDQGAQRVAMLTADSPWAWFEDTQAAYASWCAKHGFEKLTALVDRANPESTAAEASTVMLSSDTPPDAVITDVYGAALGVLRAARDLGLRVPQDLMIGSAVDGHVLETASPPITALDLQPMDVARAAVLLLERRINGDDNPAPVIVGEGYLRIRTSTQRTSAVRS
ncbi:LacI family DNA-binding transcriptional regulator [Acrocarpospora macrocephala]|uniref:LacI family transcriptional regulator n=1 Tax=Acrocarpospora macrocephala TaxID=150177 RepID=A0A5M3WLB0_9ACTN|nr:LacI family DNA-binding transcriptional regulator [Acrocarpospora macrocephala]GES08822.1 LacI family transcriptional regulator [Acrocarpospora macrocephala]